MPRFAHAVLAAALATLGAVGFAVPARADVDVKCLVDGEVTTDPPVMAMGGKGSYTFTHSELTCIGDEKGQPVTVQLKDVRSTGRYKNVTCETGKVYGDSSGITVGYMVGGAGSKDYEALAESLKYEVEFAAGSGNVYWHGPFGKYALPKPEAGNSLFDPKPQDPAKERYYGGHVRLLPAGGIPPVGECGSAFRVKGFLDIDTTPL